MSRTIFVPSCNAKQKDKTSSSIRAIWVNVFITRISKEASEAVAAETNHADQREKLNMMNVEHRKLLEEEMVNFLFEGKDVHIEGYTPPEKNKLLNAHHGWQCR